MKIIMKNLNNPLQAVLPVGSELYFINKSFLSSYFQENKGEDLPKAQKNEAYNRSQRAESNNVTLLVLDQGNLLAQIAASASFFTPDYKVLIFPEWDCVPYDYLSPTPKVLQQRLEVLHSLSDCTYNSSQSQSNFIIITTISALMQRLPVPREFFNEQYKSLRTLRAGDEIDRQQLLDFLAYYGYLRTDTVHEPGEYAIRGNLIDIFPPIASCPVRVDLFGDTIESIHFIDPGTQRRQGSVEKISLSALSEAIINPCTAENYKNNYPRFFSNEEGSDPIYQALSRGARVVGYEHWLPLLYKETCSFFDYLPDHTQVLLPQDWKHIATHNWQQIQEHYQARVEKQRNDVRGQKNRGYFAASYQEVQYLPPEALYIGISQIQQKLAQEESSLLYVRPIQKNDAVNEDFKESFLPELLKSRAEAFLQLNSQNQVIISANSPGSGDRIKKMLQQIWPQEIPIISPGSFSQGSAERLKIAIIPDYELSFKTDHLWLINESKIWNKSQRLKKVQKNISNFINELNTINHGDYIVHKEHGIGKYNGLITLKVNNIDHDFCQIVYEGGDKLMIPVENLEVISRYSSEDIEAKVDRLGTAAWQNRKAKVKNRLRMMAEQLINIAAVRQKSQHQELAPTSGLYDAFCSRFPYVETEEQFQAISDTLGDLQSGRPMDRLICGDAGFGKTEVALRAAFVVANNQYQVLIVAPTTLLCRQHYQVFSQRFDGFPMRVAQLSRLVSSTEAQKIRQQITNGEIDIIIATHAAFSKNLQFKNLGLVIVDEEQHFGVVQKEHLKNIRNNVHLLTLSATPIPRTLQMSLAGLRELSLITTPPVERIAVRTMIIEHDSRLLQEALLREHHRGGQSFYVCPYIDDLAFAQKELQEIVPQLQVGLVHGQLLPAQIEQIVSDFCQGKYHVLLSTNIIESGIDMPRVNTIIITRADRFGLGQLYQLRARVGRSKIRAYAYLTTPKDAGITHKAKRRLEVMSSLDYLGAGFALASHDLDQRGAGNILGQEQSGHIKEIGIELYQQMLEEAITDAKEQGRAENADQQPLQKSLEQSLEQSEQPLEQPLKQSMRPNYTPSINLGISVLIPESYIQNIDQRMEIYRRCNYTHNEQEIEQLAAELIDRFGALPEEVENLLGVLKLKLACWEANISRIDSGPLGIAISFYQNQPKMPEKLIKLVQYDLNVRITPEHKLFFAQPKNKYGLGLTAAINIVKEII